MSTIVYQELHPYIESTTLNLKLSAQTYNSKLESSNCSWSEIEALSKNTKEKEEQTYVHPLVKGSSFKLSEKSLELCTESLGNETGSCAMESSIFFPSMAIEGRRKPRELMKKKEFILMDHGNFPPPLTTISGSNPIHVRQFRQDGRLVIEAVKTPRIHSYMQAERSHGRLKLSMVRDYDDCCCFAQHCECRTVENAEARSGQEEACCTLTEAGCAQAEACSVQEAACCAQIEVCSAQAEAHSVQEEAKSGQEQARCAQEGAGNEGKAGECNRCDVDFLEDLKGITAEFGVSFSLGKLQRPSRCNEGGKGSKRLINWEPFWVAT